MTTTAPLGDAPLQRHTRRVARLQRMQAVVLLLVVLCSVLLTFLLGRSLLDASNERQTASRQLQSLMSMRSQMRATEVAIWTARATGQRLPIELFAQNYDSFRTEVVRLTRERAGGDDAGVSAARDQVNRAIVDVNRTVGMLVTTFTTDRTQIDRALAATEQPGIDLARGMDDWIAAASRQETAAEVRGQSISRRLFWGTVGLMTLLGVGGLLWWLGIERARSRLMSAVGESEERFRSLVQNSSDAVIVVDGAGVVRYAAPSTERLLGYGPAELVGTELARVVHPDSGGAMALLREHGAGAFRDVEADVLSWQVVHQDGSVRHLETVVSNRLDDPAIGGVILNSRDVTDRHEVEVALAYRAFHDPLTDLANRALFENRVNHALAVGERAGSTTAVLLIDLDDFKTVNDSLGHAAGDALLVETATRLKECLRSADTAARLGGDEFAILLENAGSVEEVEILAGRLVEVIREPMVVEDRELVVQASIGIAIADAAQTAASMLRNADVAMYVAKERGRADFAVFEPAMTTRATDRLGLIADLHRALERHEISLAYQPIVALDDDRICGVEALLRWRHPERGIIAPTRFVHLAEETGQIQELGRWVLSTAMREIGTIPAPAGGPPLSLAINVSTRQLERDDFAAIVGQALEASAFAPDRLIVEITESALMRDPETLLRQLQLLKQLGVRIAVDDFGTGYSSLAYLARLPIDIVKIDRTFVEGIGASRRDARIAAMIIGIGESLSLETVAEGVERPEQVDGLRALGCATAQGYYFSHPLTVDELRDRIATWDSDRRAAVPS